MSEAEPRAPSLFRELVSLGKLILGAGLIAFGCWRAVVGLFGPDDALLSAHKVRTRHEADVKAAEKQYEKGLRELKRRKATPKEKLREQERLGRELEATREAQPERDQAGYQAERWMELCWVLMAIALGPSLVWSGKSGVRWPKRGRPVPPSQP